MGQKGARGGGRQPLRQPRRCDARETVLRPAARGQVAAATRRRARPVPAPHVEAQRPVLPEGVRPGATRDTETASAQAGKRQGPRACNRGALRAWSARFRAPSSARRRRGPVGRRECQPPRDSAGAARPSSRVPGRGRTGSLGWPGTRCRARHGCCSVLCRFLGDSGRFSAPQVKRERSERWPRVRPRQESAPHSSSHAGGEVPSAALCPASSLQAGVSPHSWSGALRNSQDGQNQKCVSRFPLSSPEPQLGRGELCFPMHFWPRFKKKKLRHSQGHQLIKAKSLSILFLLSKPRICNVFQVFIVSVQYFQIPISALLRVQADIYVIYI